jgi:hypothetical protein
VVAEDPASTLFVSALVFLFQRVVGVVVVLPFQKTRSHFLQVGLGTIAAILSLVMLALTSKQSPPSLSNDLAAVYFIVLLVVISISATALAVVCWHRGAVCNPGSTNIHQKSKGPRVALGLDSAHRKPSDSSNPRKRSIQGKSSSEMIPKSPSEMIPIVPASTALILKPTINTALALKSASDPPADSKHSDNEKFQPLHNLRLNSKDEKGTRSCLFLCRFVFFLF